MNAAASRTNTQPVVVEFNRGKYGRELQIDVTWVQQTPGFITDACPHVLTFHELLLVTRGRGAVLLDGERIAVTPGVIVFCLPGQERAWQLRGKLDGACVCFAEDFITDAFADVRFLEQFAYFSVNRTLSSTKLDAREQRLFRGRFAAMRAELTQLHSDTAHRLRAALYELLVFLDRWYRKAGGASSHPLPTGYVDRFQRLVDRCFRTRHRVADYARELGCTPGYLNQLCRAQIHRSAGSVIRRRVALEARRLLLHTRLSAAQISHELGFEDASYFSRFLRRETGVVPSRLRGAVNVLSQ